MTSDTSTKDRQNNQSRKGIGDFDISRAMLRDKDMFSPFHVKATHPLREALARGDVREKTLVLLMEHKAGTLAFLTQQMVYHHLADGEIAGKPWTIIF